MTDRQTGRQIGSDRQTDRQTDGEADKTDRQTDRQIDTERENIGAGHNGFKRRTSYPCPASVKICSKMCV